MENASAEQASMEATANTEVRFLTFLIFISIDQVSSRLIWYVLIFAVIIAVIGGVIFYTLKVKKNMN